MTASNGWLLGKKVRGIYWGWWASVQALLTFIDQGPQGSALPWGRVSERIMTPKGMVCLKAPHVVSHLIHCLGLFFNLRYCISMILLLSFYSLCYVGGLLVYSHGKLPHHDASLSQFHNDHAMLVSGKYIYIYICMMGDATLGRGAINERNKHHGFISPFAKASNNPEERLSQRESSHPFCLVVYICNFGSDSKLK